MVTGQGVFGWELGVEFEEEAVRVTDKEGAVGRPWLFPVRTASPAAISKIKLALVQVGVAPHFEADVV